MTLLLSLLLLAPAAFADDVKQEFVWDIHLDGQKVGERSMTVKYLPDENGTRRVIESLTHIDATAKGVPYTFEQRLTAHAGDDPASFHSVVKDNGTPREIQGRYSPIGWTVTVVERGRTRTWDMEATQIDISSADLLDPETRVPLSGYENVQLLSVETGAVMTGEVVNSGASDLDIGGTKVPTNKIAWQADTGNTTLYYTSDGVLVSYEMAILGKSLIAKLRELPPPGVDDAPLMNASAGITETDL